MLIKTGGERISGLDWKRTCEMIESVAAGCGVSVALIDPMGRRLYSAHIEQEECDLCRKLRASVGLKPLCRTDHAKCAAQSLHFGGRYVYTGDVGFSWCAAPVIVGGKQVAALTAGPVILSSVDEFLAGIPTLAEEGDRLWDKAEVLLAGIPVKEPSAFGAISTLLLSAALYISDSSRELLLRQELSSQQQQIGERIHELKQSSYVEPYPFEKERTLLESITEGDMKMANQMLNDLLGHILLATGGSMSLIKSRCIELISVLSHALCREVAQPDEMLELSHRAIQESVFLRNMDDVTGWMNRVVRQLTAMTRDVVEADHKQLINRALAYMKRYATEKVTLEDTAEYVGFSPSYLSRVFREELGVTFSRYLSQLKVEKGKSLLLSTTMSVGEICSAVGFQDQSYFTKVFHSYVGVTPNRYRRRQGRLEPAKERDLSY